MLPHLRQVRSGEKWDGKDHDGIQRERVTGEGMEAYIGDVQGYKG